MRTIVPSMFHRRLLLLAALFAAGAAPLGWRGYQLTVARHEELLRAAESKLVKRNWMPCVRGSLVDRKGRVLAQDRPSYDIAIDYRVLTDEWAAGMAASTAKREAGHSWLDLSPAERQDRVDAWVPVFQEHLQAGWDALARTLGIGRDRLDAERDRIIAEVDGKYQEIVRLRRLREENALKDRGLPVTEDAMTAIEKQIARPIAEQTAAHVLFRKIPDATAFDCRLLAAEDVAIASPLFDAETTPEFAGRAEHSGDSAPPRSAMPPLYVERVPGLKVLDTGDREYPFESLMVQVDRSSLPGPLRSQSVEDVAVEGLLCHVLGAVRDRVYGTTRDPRTGSVTQGDAERRAAWLAENPVAAERAFMAPAIGMGVDRGEYREGDRVGDSGIERSMEHRLRGLRGVELRQLDTKEQTVIAAESGADVKLTIDALLQARVQAAMEPSLGLAKVQAWHGKHSETQTEGSQLYGAAVVLDIETGDVLSMVSTPTFTRRQLRDDPSALFDTQKYPDLLVTTPTLNRAIDKAYQPGSIVKAMMLAGAMTRGNFSADQRIACTGHLLPNNPNAYRCWVYKQFATTHNATLGHDLEASEALMVSCNIFFFTLGKRLGVDGIVDVYKRFGVGQRPEIGVGPSFPGLLGEDRQGSGLKLGDAIQMGIGQGPVAWTPLHAANAYAALARGGVMVPARLIDGMERSSPAELDLDPAGIALAMKGLELAVRDARGTGHHITFDGRQEPIFNAEGVLVWGKTGTAAAAAVRDRDPDGEGPAHGEILESGDHSWFVIMVGRDRPRYVISVVMDFAGSGGKVSGPIANQIIHALIAEGYL